jgi:DNA polymerase-1
MQIVSLSNYEYITHQEDVPFILEKAKMAKEFSVDVETTGLDFDKLRLLLFQIAFNNKAYVIDARKVDISPFRSILENDQLLKIMQSGKFDLKVLRTRRGMNIKNIFDTQLAETVLQAGKKRQSNLEYLASFYCDIALDKSVRNTFENFPYDGVFTQDQLQYAANDVLVLPMIKRMQENYLTQHGLSTTAEIEFALIPVVAQMELVGIKIDSERWRRTLAETKKSLFGMKGDLRQVLPELPTPPEKPLRYKKDGTLFKADQARLDNPKPLPVLNLDSWQQSVWAFGEIGVDLEAVSQKTRAGKTDARTINAAINIYNDDEIKVSTLQKYLKYKGLRQVEKTFGENLLEHVKPDGRVHAKFHQTGTFSGRFSSSDPNLQNIQKKGNEGKMLRSCFVPAEGHKFIIADYSQIELRIVAELSKDPNMLEILNDPKGDIHRLTAAQMNSVAYEDVTNAMRHAAKTLNFGLIYGMTINTLAERIKSSMEEANKQYSKYRKTYPVLLDFIEQEGENALNRGQSKTMGGRIRWFPSVAELDKKKQAFYKRVGRNHPVQGTSADMTKVSMIYLFEPLKKLDANIVNSVHDELCVEVPEDNAIEAAKLVKEKMIVAGKKFLTKVPVLVDIKIRDCWWKDDGIEDDENGWQLIHVKSDHQSDWGSMPIWGEGNLDDYEDEEIDFDMQDM